MGKVIGRSQTKTNISGGGKMRRRECKLSLIVVIIGIFFLGRSFLSAQEVKEEQTGPVILNPAPAQEEEVVEKLQFQEKPKIKGYTYNLKRLLEQTEENIQKVKEEIEQAEIGKRNEEREAKAIEHFERGNALYKEGGLKEAKEEWQKALDVSKDPEMKEYINEAEKRAREEELARKKEAAEKQKRLEAEQKEKRKKLEEQADIEKEKARLELKQQQEFQRKQQEQLEEERKAKEEAVRKKKARFEKERREQERQFAEQKRREELAQKKAEVERLRQQKEERSRLEKEQKEQGRLEREKQKQLEFEKK